MRDACGGEKHKVNWWVIDSRTRGIVEVGVWLMSEGERVTREWAGEKGRRDESEDRQKEELQRWTEHREGKEDSEIRSKSKKNHSETGEAEAAEL